MTLVDTSVWVDHFRRTIPSLVQQLHDGTVLCHPFVIGELALGALRRRDAVIDLIEKLPALDTAEHHNVLRFVDTNRLGGSGIGWVDAHLLCAAVEAGVHLWTNDRKLRAEAARLGLFP